jgi:hypothetical protein
MRKSHESTTAIAIRGCSAASRNATLDGDVVIGSGDRNVACSAWGGGWPSDESWAELNQRVGGRLTKVQFPLGACLEEGTSATCAASTQPSVCVSPTSSRR